MNRARAEHPRAQRLRLVDPGDDGEQLALRRIAQRLREERLCRLVERLEAVLARLEARGAA